MPKDLISYLDKNNIPYTCDQEQLRSFSRNYGGPFSLPQVVVSPKTLKNIIDLVVYANNKKIPIAVKGFGHSTGKQNEVAQGILIDIRSYSRIHGLSQDKTGASRIHIDAGASWKELLDYTLDFHLMPYVFTDWLWLTLGGTVSMGGIGANSFRYGLQSDHLTAATVISKLGEPFAVDKENHADLFNGVRAGLGQLGIITDLTMDLRQSPQSGRLYKQVFTDLPQFFKALFSAVKNNKVDGMIAHIECNLPEILARRLGKDFQKIDKNNLTSKWVAILEGTQFIFSEKRVKPLLEFGTLPYTEYSIKDYLQRIPPILDSDLESEMPLHVECTMLLPYNKSAIALVQSVLASLTYEHMGYGPILIVPLTRAMIKSPFFITPQAPYFFLIGILSRQKAHNALCQESMAIMRHFYQESLKIGGCRYPCDSLIDQDWPSHFGHQWTNFRQLKRLFDPNNIYSPGFHIHP